MRQAERRAKTLASLVRAARPLLARNGYAGTSLDAIAAGAGLSKGAVYAHLTSKAELYHMVAECVLAEATSRVAQVEQGLACGEPAHIAARAAFGRDDDDQHAALVADLWQVAAIDGTTRGLLEAHRRERLDRLAASAIRAGVTPPEALREAGTAAALMDAGILDRRLGFEAAG
ncbi:MAG: TetR/AcrR family transcriptional regulator [Dehalococcoidia bacterium]|nr:TetR/AcrR family transcriptional regulator [Dehalococcoidia bacterium]